MPLSQSLDTQLRFWCNGLLAGGGTSRSQSSSDLAAVSRWCGSFRWAKPLVAVVQYELFLGVWLLSGLFPRTAWWLAIGTFGLFAIVSGGKALVGDPTCACFGRVPTSPWLSLSINVSVILVLWLSVVVVCFAVLTRSSAYSEDLPNALAIPQE